MSFYGSGQGGWFKAGDLVVSTRSTLGQTGQKLLPADGSAFDPVAYPDLAAIYQPSTSFPTSPTEYSDGFVATWNQGSPTLSDGNMGFQFTTTGDMVATERATALADFFVEFEVRAATGSISLGIGNHRTLTASGMSRYVLYSTTGLLYRDAPSGGNLTLDAFTDGDLIAFYASATTGMLHVYKNGVEVYTQDITDASWSEYTVRAMYGDTGTDILMRVDSTKGDYDYPAPLKAHLTPDYTASSLSYMVVAENAPLPTDMFLYNVETAMYKYAGDMVVSHSDFLEDGRNLVPCDGGAIDVRFTDLTAIKIDGILPDYKHSGVPYRVVAQNPGTSGIADYSHIDNIYSGQPLTWAHETGGMTATVQNGGTTSIKSGGSYGVHYTEDLLSHDYGGSEEVWWELEVISITRDDRTSIGFRTDKTGGYSYEASGNYYLINTDGIAILTTTSGNLIVDLEATTIPDSGLNPGDLFAFKLNNTTKWVTMYKNGVLLPNTFRVSVASELYFIVGTGSSSCTWEVNLRTMESRDNHTYLD